MSDDDRTNDDQSAQIDDLEELLDEARKKDAQDSPDIPDTGDSSNDEVQDLKVQLARAQADYSNLLRRTQTQLDEVGAFAKSNAIEKFLPIADTFDRAIEHLPQDLEDNEWVKGILGLSTALEKVLKDLEVGPFTSIGDEVDVDKHEVVSQGPGEQDVIVAEIQKGYMIGDQVLRHAKVVVGNGG